MQIPDKDCPLCPRLASFREENRIRHPDYFNAPVPAWGSISSELLIVGLAPGLKGANQTGRPFIGDYAGFLLYPTLEKYGFAQGDFRGTLPETGLARAEEGSYANSIAERKGTFRLVNCRITNAVRCVPPENKPELSEIKTCNQFLFSEINAMGNLKVILSLGLVSHNAVLRALGQKMSAAKFIHGAVYPLGNIKLVDSYHCSRYNINTGKLTGAMFSDVILKVSKLI